MPTSSSNSRRGFTTLELITVLTIIGIVSSLSVVAIRSHSKQTADGLIRGLQNLINRGRREAAAAKARRWLEVNLDEGLIVLSKTAESTAEDVSNDDRLQAPTGCRFIEIISESGQFRHGRMVLAISSLGVIESAELQLAADKRLYLIKIPPFMPHLVTDVKPLPEELR